MTTKFDFLPTGARVTCEYRMQHQGTVLSATDPVAWYGRFQTQEEVAIHLEKMEKMNRRLHSQYGMPLISDNRQPVAWDFGRVYWESASALAIIEQPS